MKARDNIEESLKNNPKFQKDYKALRKKVVS